MDAPLLHLPLSPERGSAHKVSSGPVSPNPPILPTVLLLSPFSTVLNRALNLLELQD